MRKLQNGAVGLWIEAARVNDLAVSVFRLANLKFASN
jgi:hypothetical protein